MAQNPRESGFVPVVGQVLPVVIGVQSDPIGGVNTETVSVTVNQTGGYIQLGTDRPDILVSPSLAWPYNVDYPSGGALTRSVTLNVNVVSADTSVKIYACPSSVDASNSANWSVVQTITVHPIGWTPNSGGG